MLEGEEELDKHLERGYCSLQVWKDYWWSQRASALIEIDAIERRATTLREYVKRCAERIDRQPPSTVSDEQS